MIDSKFISSVRKAGKIVRCHTLGEDTDKGYNVGNHCYNALSLLLTLNPSASSELIKTVLWHDTSELWLGDMPSTAKWNNPDLKQAYAEAENKIDKSLGIDYNLNDQEMLWMKAVDILELWMWAIEDSHHSRKSIRHECEKYMETLDMPSVARVFYNRVKSEITKYGSNENG